MADYLQYKNYVKTTGNQQITGVKYFLNSIQRPIITVTTNYSITINNYYVLVNGGTLTNLVITLPDAITYSGIEFKIKNIGTLSAVTVNTINNQLINTSLNLILNIGTNSVTVVSNGVSWISL